MRRDMSSFAGNRSRERVVRCGRSGAPPFAVADPDPRRDRDPDRDRDRDRDPDLDLDPN
jgi:hypothetical protein